MTARPRRAQHPRDAAATRQTLIDAAAEAFTENGFAGARVEAIARRARVNKALIYAYYGDKEGLYRAVLSSRLAAPVLSLARAADRDAFRSLEDVVRAYLGLLVEDRAFARLLAWDLLSPNAGRRAALVESLRPALELIDNMVRRARACGALAVDVTPEMFRIAVIALGLGYSIQHSAIEADRLQTGVHFGDGEFVDYARRLVLPHRTETVVSTRRRAR